MGAIKDFYNSNKEKPVVADTVTDSINRGVIKDYYVNSAPKVSPVQSKPDMNPLKRVGLEIVGNIKNALGGTINAYETFGNFLLKKGSDATGVDAQKLAKANANILGYRDYDKTKAITSEPILKSAEQDIAKATENTKGVGKLALDVIGSGANMATGAGVSLLTGIPFTAQMGIQAGGNSAQQAKEQGKTIEQQFKYGTTSGIAEGAIESIGGYGASKVLKKGATSLLTKLSPNLVNALSKAGSTFIGKHLSSALGEGVEEATSYNVDRFLQSIILDNETPFELKDMAYQSLVGGVMGVFGGGKANPKPITPNLQGLNQTTAQNQPQAPQQAVRPQTPIAPIRDAQGQNVEQGARRGIVSNKIFKVGDTVKALDRNNFGKVLNYNPNTKEYLVRFTSKDGLVQDVTLPQSKVTSISRGNFKTKIDGEVDFDNLPTPENSVVIEPQKQGVNLGSVLSKAYTRAVDTQNPIVKFSKVAKDKSDVLASNSRGAGGTVNYIFTDALTDRNGKRIGGSLKDVISPIPKGQEKAFWDYMAMRHNVDRAREGKNVIANYDSAMSAKATADIEGKNPQFKTIGDGIVSWIDTFMSEWGVNSGLIDSDIYAQLRETYPSYFPTQREFDEIENSLPTEVRKQFVDAKSPVKKATGSDRDINYPVENIMNLVNQTVKSARYNSVGQSILNSIRQNPTGLSKYAEIIKDVDGKASQADNVVTVLESGKKVYLKINDAELLQSLQGLPKTTMTVPVLSSATNLFKSLITQKNPFFAVRNIARDVPTAYTYGSEMNPFKFAKGLANAGKDVATNSENYQMYKAMGGGMSNFFTPSKVEKSAQQLTGQPNIFKKISGGIEAFNNMTETTPRLAEFNRVFERTGDIQQAIYAANNVTVNFARGGDLTRALDRNGVAYLNAGVQGLDKFIRSFKSPRLAIATIVKGGISVFASTFILHLINKDDEEYKKLSNYIKDNYYCIPMGNGEFIKIPKSRELGVLFGALPERIARLASGEKDAFKGFGNTVMTSFAPTNPFENNILSPAVINLKSNKTYSGAQIVPQGMIQDKRSAYLQYDEKTSEITKAIAKYAKQVGVDLSPKQMDYLIDAYTGVIADFLLPATTESKTVKNTLKSQFVVDPTYSNQSVVDFYDNYDKASRISADKNLTGNVSSKEMTIEEKLESAMSKASGKMSELTKIALRANLGTLTADDNKILKEHEINLTLKGDELQKVLREKRVEISKEANNLYNNSATDEFALDMYRSETISEKVQTYTKAAGISEKTAYGVYKALDALEPAKKDGNVTDVQKADAVIDFVKDNKLSAKQEAALVNKVLVDGKDTPTLTMLTDHAKLVTLYAQTGKTSVVNMKTPEKFDVTNKGVKTEYVLTDREKELFTKTYIEYLNRYTRGIFSSKNTDWQVKQIEKWKENANAKAKEAVIKSR